MIFIALFLLSGRVRAADVREEVAEAVGAEELEELAEGTGLSEYGSILGGYDIEGFLGKLLTETLRTVVSPDLFRDLGAVLTTVLLLAAVRTLAPEPTEGFDAASLACASGVMLLMSGTQHSLTVLAEETLVKLQDIANALLPVLAAASLMSGQVTAAAAKYSAAALFLNVLTNLCCGFLLPLVRLYLAAAAAEAAVGNGVMNAVLGFLKWCGATVLSCLMLAFTLYLSLTSMASNAADAAIVRSTKTAVSAMLPVVGSIAGDAASSLLAAAGLIRQAVGAFGLLVISAAILAPFFQTGIRYLLLKGVAAISSELAESRMCRLLKRLSESMALLMGCIGSCGLMLFFSVYSLLRAVGQ